MLYYFIDMDSGKVGLHPSDTFQYMMFTNDDIDVFISLHIPPYHQNSIATNELATLEEK